MNLANLKRLLEAMSIPSSTWETISTQIVQDDQRYAVQFSALTPDATGRLEWQKYKPIEINPADAKMIFLAPAALKLLLPIVKAVQEFTIQAKNLEYHPWYYMYREGSDSYVCLACGQIEENPHLEDCAAIALEISIKQLEGSLMIKEGDALQVTPEFVEFGKTTIQWDIHTTQYIKSLPFIIAYKSTEDLVFVVYGSGMGATIPMQLALNMRTAYLKREAST